jgi:alpha-1,2-mannosyltransferase
VIGEGRRSALAALLGLPLLVGGAAIALLASAAGDLPYLDLQVMTQAVQAWWSGSSPYGTDILDGLQFNYPPSALVLLGPLAAAPLLVAGGLLVVAGAAVLLLVARWALPGSPRGALVLAGALALSEPVMTTWLYGQVNLVVLLLVCSATIRVRSGMAAGGLLGGAAGLKLAPAAFLVLPVVDRQWRSVAVAASTVAGLLILAALRVPSILGDWLGQVAAGVVVVRPEDAGRNASWRGLLEALAPDAAVVLWWIAVLVGGAGVLVGVVAALRAERRVVAVAVVALGVLLLSPVSWTHHWVWVPVVLGAALARSGRRSLDLATLVAAALLLVATMLWLPVQGMGPDRVLATDGWAWLLSYSYVLLGTAALALLIAREVVKPGRREDPATS